MGFAFRHPHDESPDLRQHARTPAPPARVRPFPRDQLPMPPQNRVGRDDHGDLVQPATAQPVPTHGQLTPLVIAQPHAPPMELAPEDAILFDQIGQGLLLAMIQPADQGGEKNPGGRHVNHGGSLSHRAGF